MEIDAVRFHLICAALTGGAHSAAVTEEHIAQKAIKIADLTLALLNTPKPVAPKVQPQNVFALSSPVGGGEDLRVVGSLPGTQQNSLRQPPTQ